MPVLTQPPSMGDVLKYEVNPNYTRETVTLLMGMPYPVGAVLGKITASGKYKLATSGGTDGAQTATAVLLYAVDATLADAVGIVVARGPSIVSRAAWPMTPPSMTRPRSPPSSASWPPSALSPATAPDVGARIPPSSLPLTPWSPHDHHPQPV
jgi:hypothetical protein